MEPITYKNILQFLERLPEENAKNTFEELLNGGKVPDNWTHLGTLADEETGFGNALYKPWSHYAIGFYPYNGCDIYKDDKNRILLSYVELGGHAPFRRSFVATKTSPFIFEPVNFDVFIGAQDHSRFLEVLESIGLNSGKMERDLARFKGVYQITEELDASESYLFSRYFYEATNEYRYTIITGRDTAHLLKKEFG